MAILTLLRHGQSEWNLQNRFTGWVDVDLSPQGIEEAHRAGKILKDEGISFQRAHTSRLVRAQRTLEIVMQELGVVVPTWIDSALNERHYGDLQGLNKDETRKKYGDEQVHIWRRSYDIAPPNGECLADTAKRTVPYFKEYILKDVMSGQNLIVSAHGNSLRSIIMLIEALTPEQILKVEIETGVPYLYDINDSGEIIDKKILT